MGTIMAGIYGNYLGIIMPHSPLGASKSSNEQQDETKPWLDSAGEVCWSAWRIRAAKASDVRGTDFDFKFSGLEGLGSGFGLRD